MNEWATKSINVKPSTKERINEHISSDTKTQDEIIVKLLDFWDDNHE